VTDPDFAHSPNKVWKFAVSAAPTFNILDKIKALDAYSYAVEAMFSYEHSSCNNTYQNLWNLHFNPAYRLAGLLLAYVERVNLVWQKLAT
jgi:hypothetical protein